MLQEELPRPHRDLLVSREIDRRLDRRRGRSRDDDDRVQGPGEGRQPRDEGPPLRADASALHEGERPLNSEEAHAQRAAEKLDKESKLEKRAGGNKLGGRRLRRGARRRRPRARTRRTRSWCFTNSSPSWFVSRSGAPTRTTGSTSWRRRSFRSPSASASMLHEVVRPLAQRDDSALFKDKLAEDEDMQAALTEYKEKLKVWFNKETQSMHLCGEKRKIKYEQWQEVLKKGKVIGIWEVTLPSCSNNREQRRRWFLPTTSHRTGPPGVRHRRRRAQPHPPQVLARCRRRSSPSSTRSRSTRSAPASPPTTPTRRRSTGTSSSSASRAIINNFSLL